MVDNILKRARIFIGLDDGGMMKEGVIRQMEFGIPQRKDRKGSSSEEGEYEIITYEPKVYEDSLNISQHLRRGCPVIISLKNLEPGEGTRLIDFVCGTAYAIDGHMIKIAESIFLFTPNNIVISDMEGRASLETSFVKEVPEKGEDLEEEETGSKFFSRNR